jgi:hypothetical protein
LFLNIFRNAFVNDSIDLHPIACFFILSFIESLLNHHSEDIPRFDWEIVAEMDAEVVGGVVADVIGEVVPGVIAGVVSGVVTDVIGEMVPGVIAGVVGGVVTDVIGEGRTGRTASCGHSPENPSMPKTSKRTETIEVQCTPEQKTQIRQYATGAGTSMSTYLLDCGLKRRRQVEGPLINLSLFQQLEELTEVLKELPRSQLLEDVLALIWEVRREIALKRLGDAVEKVLPKL